MRETLLSRDAADEEDVGAINGHAVTHKRLDGLIRSVGLGVDAVVHDMHASGSHLRVRRQDVPAHALAHGDDRLRVGVRRRLDPGAHTIATAQLLDLPRAQGLERMGGDDMGDTVEQPPDMPGEVGVPRVRVEDIDPGGVAHHLQIDPEGLQCGVSAGELGRHRMCFGIRSRRSEAVHVDVDQRAQMSRQLAHVHARAPVDIRGPLAGEDGDLHGCSVGPALWEPEV